MEITIKGLGFRIYGSYPSNILLRESTYVSTPLLITQQNNISYAVVVKNTCSQNFHNLGSVFCQDPFKGSVFPMVPSLQGPLEQPPCIQPFKQEQYAPPAAA